jgi:hypothetical protein
VVATYKINSKARFGAERTIQRKETVEHPWKAEIVRMAAENKRRQGPGRPPIAAGDDEVEMEHEEITFDELEDELHEFDEEYEEDELL